VQKWLIGAFAALIALGGTAVPALAQTDPTYPVTSFRNWTTGPQNDFQHDNNSRGQYVFQAGTVNAINRALTRWPQHYNPANLFQNLAAESQAATDAAFHAPPDLPYDHVGIAPNPDYMPDFDHNGVFGDPGDFDVDSDATPDSAPFRYPCPQLDGTVLYETTAGTCKAGTDTTTTFKLGEAREAKVVDSRGYVLDATLWLPGEAVNGSAPGPFPGVVYGDGFTSRQDSYYWFAMRMARAGYVALTYDPAGQGDSEGTAYALWDSRMAPCYIGGACRDLQDVVRWFVGADIKPVARQETRATPPKSPAYAPAGDNVRNPVLGQLDTTRISVSGNSMGALAVDDYTYSLAGGAGGDGRPLPPLRAAIPMSGIGPMKASIPIQFQESDDDGSPTLAGPGVGGVPLGNPNFGGIGYAATKQTYDQLRAARQGSDSLALVVIEGGTHLDWVDTPYATKTTWSLAVSGDAALDFFDCHARDSADACQRAASPRPRLSRAFASEQDADGPAGPAPSRCITVPDQASLNQSPPDFVNAETGHPVYDCTP
jgi:hypothetical protein